MIISYSNKFNSMKIIRKLIFICIGGVVGAGLILAYRKITGEDVGLWFYSIFGVISALTSLYLDRKHK